MIPAVANIMWGFVCMFFLPERPEDMSSSSEARAFMLELNSSATTNMIPVAVLELDIIDLNSVVINKIYNRMKMSRV